MSKKNNDREKKGKLFVVSAPSGAGKTSLCNKLLSEYENLKYSISYTTRAPRDRERDGKDYFFVSESVFESMIRNDEFIEWAVVHENYYGTSKNFILNNLKNGYDIILDIDPQGARTLRSKLGFGIYIFIIAPSIKDLENRLRKRKSETKEKMDKRLKNALKEVQYFRDYDYMIVNRDYNQAFKELESIFISEHLRTEDIDDIKNIMDLEV